jgi:hypothetical protein
VSGRIACLDASVLIPQPTGDILLRLAEADIYRPVWSPQILNEVARNLVAKWATATPERVQRRLEAMNRAFPDALIDRPGSVTRIPDRVDEKDRHVVGTALAGRAQVIVTNNVRDFAATELVRDLGVKVQTADAFLTDQWGIDRRAAATALARQVAALRSPPRSLEDHVEALRAAQLEAFAHLVDRDLELVGAAILPARID